MSKISLSTIRERATETLRQVVQDLHGAEQLHLMQLRLLRKILKQMESVSDRVPQNART